MKHPILAAAIVAASFPALAGPAAAQQAGGLVAVTPPGQGAEQPTQPDAAPAAPVVAQPAPAVTPAPMAQPTPALSEPREAAQSGSELWNGVRSDMSRDQVEALFPARGGKVKHKSQSIEIENVAVVGKCEAEAEIFFAQGKVERIELKGKGSIAGRCADQVFSALSAKYGQPDGTNSRKGDGFLSRAGAQSIWSKPGVTMTFKQYNDNDFGGSGLLQHSWRMTYSTLAQVIGL